MLRALRKAGFTVDKVFGGVHDVAYEPGAVENPVVVEKWGERIPAFPVEVLVLAKFYSDQPLDRWDIAALYEHGSFEPETVRALLATTDPENVDAFDALMAEIRRPRGGRKRPPPRQG